MSQTEKQDVLSSMHTTSTLPFSTVDDSNVLTKPHLNVASGNLNLSVPFSSLRTILSDGQLEAMWKKASRLLNEKKVIKAPDSNPKTRWVARDHHPM